MSLINCPTEKHIIKAFRDRIMKILSDIHENMSTPNEFGRNTAGNRNNVLDSRICLPQCHFEFEDNFSNIFFLIAQI